MKLFRLLLGCILITSIHAKKQPRDPSMGMARHVMGSVKLMGKDTLSTTEVKLGDMIPSNKTVITDDNGLLVLRFHPDFERIEARAKTRYQLAYSRSDTTKPRQIRLHYGMLVLGVPKHCPPIQAEDTHSKLRADDARFSVTSNPKTSTSIVVLDGSVEVHNRAKDVTGFVRRGQKAVSDMEGLRITDASDTELEQVGLRQNILEVDFWNPETEDYNTLEVEYESNF